MEEVYKNIICTNFDHLDFKIGNVYLLEFEDTKKQNKPLISNMLIYEGMWGNTLELIEGKEEILSHAINAKDNYGVRDTLQFTMVSTNHHKGLQCIESNKFGWSINFRNQEYINKWTLLSE